MIVVLLSEIDTNITTDSFIPQYHNTYSSKFGPPMFPQIFCRSVVEIRIKLVNDASVFLNGMEANLVGFPAGAPQQVQESDQGEGVEKQPKGRRHGGSLGIRRRRNAHCCSVNENVNTLHSDTQSSDRCKEC
jgi:hypothetical protein